MNKINKICLDGNPIVDEFICDRLKIGKTLSRLFLEEDKIKQGKKFTLLPETITHDRALDFLSGGIFSIDSKRERKRKGGNGKTWSLIPLQSTESELLAIANAYLELSKNRIIVVEDALAKASDPFLLAGKTNYFTYEDEVYHFAESGTDPSRIIATIRRLSFIPTSICFFTSLLEEESLKDTIVKNTENELASLSKRTETAVIKAYDGESYVFWEK